MQVFWKLSSAVHVHKGIQASTDLPDAHDEIFQARSARAERVKETVRSSVHSPSTEPPGTRTGSQPGLPKKTHTCKVLPKNFKVHSLLEICAGLQVNSQVGTLPHHIRKRTLSSEETWLLAHLGLQRDLRKTGMSGQGPSTSGCRRRALGEVHSAGWLTGGWWWSPRWVFGKNGYIWHSELHRQRWVGVKESPVCPRGRDVPWRLRRGHLEGNRSEHGWKCTGGPRDHTGRSMRSHRSGCGVTQVRLQNYTG